MDGALKLYFMSHNLQVAFFFRISQVVLYFSDSYLRTRFAGKVQRIM